MAASPSDKLREAKVFFVMGGPGSGKATQCRQMVAKYGLTHLSSGDLLRAEVALGTEGGRRLNRIMSHGELVPLIDILHLLRDAMRARVLDSPGFLIEGFPRDIEQAEAFECELAPCHGVIYLHVSDDIMRQRLLRRAREKDNVDTVVTKLQLYLDRTQPVIDKYQKLGLVIKINGQGTVDEVFERIQQGLMKFKGRSNKKLSKDDSPVLKRNVHKESSTSVSTLTSVSDPGLDIAELANLDQGGHVGKPADKLQQNQGATTGRRDSSQFKDYGKARSQSPKDQSPKASSAAPASDETGKSD